MVVLSVFVGLLYGPINPIGNLAMQVLTPEVLRGRVVGIITSTAYAAGPLGLLIAGPLVAWLGVEGAAILFAGLTHRRLGLGLLHARTARPRPPRRAPPDRAVPKPAND